MHLVPGVAGDRDPVVAEQGVGVAGAVEAPGAHARPQVAQPQEALAGGDHVLDGGAGRLLAAVAHDDVRGGEIGGAGAGHGHLHGLPGAPHDRQDRVEGDVDPGVVPRRGAGEGAGQRRDGRGRGGLGAAGEVRIGHELRERHPAGIAARIARGGLRGDEHVRPVPVDLVDDHLAAQHGLGLELARQPAPGLGVLHVRVPGVEVHGVRQRRVVDPGPGRARLDPERRCGDRDMGAVPRGETGPGSGPRRGCGGGRVERGERGDGEAGGAGRGQAQPVAAGEGGDAVRGHGSSYEGPAPRRRRMRDVRDRGRSGGSRVLTDHPRPEAPDPRRAAAARGPGRARRTGAARRVPGRCRRGAGRSRTRPADRGRSS